MVRRMSAGTAECGSASTAGAGLELGAHRRGTPVIFR
jgi:hypothetical protein